MMTEHDIEMQQRHEDALYEGAEVAEAMRNERVQDAYSDYMELLHEPTMIGLIDEAFSEARTVELAKLIQAEPKDFAAIGVLVCQIVQNHVLQVAKKDVAREMGE